MFCDQCGTQLPDGTKFCTNCGNKIAVATPMSQQQPIPMPQQQPQPQGFTQAGYGYGQVPPNYGYQGQGQGQVPPNYGYQGQGQGQVPPNYGYQGQGQGQYQYQQTQPNYGYPNQAQPNYNQGGMYANVQSGQAERTAQTVRTIEIVISILWICISVYQFYNYASLWGYIDGTYVLIPIWNGINAVIGITNASKITAGNSAVVSSFNSRIVHNVIAFCINAYIRAYLGCLLAIAEVGLSIYVLNNKSAFTPAVEQNQNQ